MLNFQVASLEATFNQKILLTYIQLSINNYNYKDILK